MNSFKIAVKICVVILVVGGLGAAALGSRLVPARTELTLQRISSSIEAVSGRMEELEARMAVLERSTKALERSAVESTKRAASPSGAEAGASVAEVGGEPSTLVNLNEAQSQELRELIADVVRKERADRKTREKEQAAALQLEMAEMSKGPYGEHNYTVNSLGKKLSLSDFQKQRYYDQLLAHRQRLRELRRGVNFSDADAAKSYRDRRREADDDLETTLVTYLTPEQKEAYDALSPLEKGGSEGAVFFSTAEGAGGEMSLDVVHSAIDAAEVALPLPLGLPLDGEVQGITVDRLIDVVPGGGAEAPPAGVKVKMRASPEK